MCISFFGMTVAEAHAADNLAQKLFTVKDSVVKDGKITFTISLTAGVEGFGGAVLLAEYDNTVLKPSEDSAPACNDAGVQYLKGMFTHGNSVEQENVYSIGYINNSPEAVTKVTPFFKLTFDVIDESHPLTAVNFYCREFYSTDDSDSSITVGDGLQPIASFQSVTTLEAPRLVSASLFSGGIRFTWEASEGANGYEIRRKTTDSAWQLLAEVSADALSYEDVGLVSGETYTYSVKAVNGYGASLFNSTGVSAKYVAKPSISSLTNSVGGVEIKWNVTAGADSYTILRREAGSNTWQTIITRSSASAAIYKDTKVENGKTYEYDINSSLGSFVTDSAFEGEKITYLESPNITAAANTEEGIEVSWSGNDSADYYVVYRKEIGKDTELTEYATSAPTTYLDTNVEVGKAYTYSVMAVADYGDSAYTKTGYNITRVSGTRVTNLAKGTDNVTVFWAGISKVDGYKIYRKTEASSWELVGSAGKNDVMYKDTSVESGAKYFYAAVPFVGKSEGPKICSNMSVYFLEAPSRVEAVNIKNAIKVSWGVSKGAKEYELWRKDGENGSYTLLALISDPSQTQYIDTDVVDGGVYRYSLKAISNIGESDMSDFSPATMRMECVTGVETAFVKSGISIIWNEHAKAEKYRVFRNEDGIWYEITDVSGTGYVDEDVKSGQTYAYAIKPIIGEYVGGFDEESVVFFKYLAPPSKITTKNTASSIIVSWNGAAGAKNYELWRATVSSSGKVGKFSKIKVFGSGTASYEDKNVTAGQSYAYMLYSLDDDLISVSSEQALGTFLVAPTISKLSNTYGGVSVTWKSVKGATSYNVYRKYSSDKSWTKLKNVPSSTLSYTDSGAKSNEKVYYAVTALNDYSSSTYVAKGLVYFAAPKLTVGNANSGISLSWNKISGANSYYIYRKKSDGKSWERIATVTKTSYTDKNVSAGKTYTYSIRAYNGSVLSGYNTSGWSVKRLTTPKLTKVENKSNGVKITWGKVSGANSYYVYRKQSGDKGWTRLATVTSTNYTDKKAVGGSSYYYTVKAVSEKTVSAHNSTGLSIKFLSAPSVTSISNATKGISVKWGSVKGASGYYLYRKENGAKSWTRIAELTGTSYTDKNVKNGKTYAYTVKAVSGSTSSAYNTNGWSIKFISAPKLSTPTSSKSGVTVKWGKVSGASGYYVYRKIGTGSYELIATIKDGSTASYKDKNVKKNVTYTYTVRAYKGSAKSACNAGVKCTQKY